MLIAVNVKALFLIVRKLSFKSRGDKSNVWQEFLGIQNTGSVAIVVLGVVQQNRSNAAIAFHIVVVAG